VHGHEIKAEEDTLDKDNIIVGETTSADARRRIPIRYVSMVTGLGERSTQQ